MKILLNRLGLLFITMTVAQASVAMQDDGIQLFPLDSEDEMNRYAQAGIDDGYESDGCCGCEYEVVIGHHNQSGEQNFYIVNGVMNFYNAFCCLCLWCLQEGSGENPG